MALSDILSGVDTFVKKELTTVEKDVSSWWTGFEPILEADLQKFVSALQPIALALVTGLAETALSGSQKFSIASSALVSTAKAQGIAATKTMGDQLVQQIVTSLSVAKPPAP